METYFGIWTFDNRDARRNTRFYSNARTCSNPGLYLSLANKNRTRIYCIFPTDWIGPCIWYCSRIYCTCDYPSAPSSIVWICWKFVLRSDRYPSSPYSQKTCTCRADASKSFPFVSPPLTSYALCARNACYIGYLASSSTDRFLSIFYKVFR